MVSPPAGLTIKLGIRQIQLSEPLEGTEVRRRFRPVVYTTLGVALAAIQINIDNQTRIRYLNSRCFHLVSSIGKRHTR